MPDEVLKNSWYTYAFAARVGLILFGLWQDTQYAVKYTDVDYYVFSDAAQFVTKGESPYLRATYRYTPILAWALTLNVWLSPLIGKLVFITFDVLVGHAIHKLILELGHDQNTAKNCALVWLLNPLPAVVSSRGNAESIMAYLVLKSLTHLVQGNVISSSVYYALAIHFKIYPVAFALPIYLYLGRTQQHQQQHKRSNDKDNKEITKDCNWILQAIMLKLIPNKKQILFVSVGGFILGSLTSLFYLMYGWTFLYETYIYHIFRGDIRHNFSPYFYLLYLTSDPVTGVPLCLRLLVFLPQVVLMVAMALRYYRDQPFCWFLCTFVFVMANKVCTSQYFLWYLSLLPVILPNLKMTVTKSVGLLLLWFGAQGLWLFPAFLLEFKSYSIFLIIWAAGLLFLCANTIIVWLIIKHYKVKTR